MAMTMNLSIRVSVASLARLAALPALPVGAAGYVTS